MKGKLGRRPEAGASLARFESWKLLFGHYLLLVLVIFWVYAWNAMRFEYNDCVSRMICMGRPHYRMIWERNWRNKHRIRWWMPTGCDIEGTEGE